MTERVPPHHYVLAAEVFLGANALCAAQRKVRLDATLAPPLANGFKW
jgi:hypothetical protein